MAATMGRVQRCVVLSAVRDTKPRVLVLSGEILIGNAIIAISLLYASRTPRPLRASRRAGTRSREETKSGWNQTQFRSGLTCREQRWHRDERNTASRGAVQHRHRSFCIVAICYFVHIHNGVTSHQRVPMRSLAPVAFFSLLTFFPAFRFHVHGYQSVVVIHQRPPLMHFARIY